MAPPKTALEYFAQPAIQRALEALSNDSQKALDQSRKVLTSSLGKCLTGSTLSKYKGDIARLDKSAIEYSRAAMRLQFGKTNDLQEVIATYARYVIALEALEQSNARLVAMISAGFSATVAILLKSLMTFEKDLQKQCKKLAKELKELQKIYAKIRWDSYEAKMQAYLHVSVNALVISLGPVGLLTKAGIGVWVASTSVNTVVNHALGPSAKSKLSLIDTNAGLTTQFFQAVSTGLTSLFKTTSAIATMSVDFKEVVEADKNLKDLRKRLKAVTARYQSLHSSAKGWDARISKQKKLYDTALRAFNASAKKFKSAKGKREKILKEFRKWK